MPLDEILKKTVYKRIINPCTLILRVIPSSVTGVAYLKGPFEVRVINQHVKISKTHLKNRQMHCFGSGDEATGVIDIRSYLKGD